MLSSDLLQKVLLSVHLALVKCLLLCSAVTFRAALGLKCRMEFSLVSCRAGLGILWSIDRINFLTGCPSSMQCRGARPGCRKGALSLCHWVGTTPVCSATLPAVRAQHSREIAVPVLGHVTSMLSMEPQFWWEVLSLFLNVRCCSWGSLRGRLSIPKSGSALTAQIAVHLEPALRFRFLGWEESLQPSILSSPPLLCFLMCEVERTMQAG